MDVSAGMPWTNIAASAYRAYAACTGNKTFQGHPMPPWDELSLATQTAWEAAVRQVDICLRTPALAQEWEVQWAGWIPPHLKD